MADDTYQPLVYMTEGGDEQVVASGGAITIEDGGSIAVEAGGNVAMPVVADTTATTMANYGVSRIANASSALSTFVLDSPVAGVQKFIFCDGTFGSTAIGYIDAGSGVTIDSTERYMSIKSASATMHLIGANTTSWEIVYATGSTVSTGST